jgi:integrase/recombinase XerD
MSDHNFARETWLSKLRDHLKEERYATKTASRCVPVARHFLTFLDKQHVEASTARPCNIEGYLQEARRRYRRRHGHVPDYKAWQAVHTSSVRMLLRVVQGTWPPGAVPTTPAEMWQQAIRDEYAQWLSDSRGLAPATISDCCAEAAHFFDWLGARATQEGLATLALADVDAYLKCRTASVCRRTRSTIAARVRGLLRWFHVAGHTVWDLASAVIAPSMYAFEDIPMALRAQDVQQVVTVARGDGTPKGRRDYAILMLLATYGLRAGEITALRLDDIDWRKNVIRIRHSKTRVTSYLPLQVDVGEALLTYLQKSRPKTSRREIFLRCRAPYRPLNDGSSLYGLVQCRLAAANVVPTGKRGPHAFRHARALSLLRASVPVKEIGDVLGHRAAAATLVYLKLATEDLRAVALELPTEVTK